MWIELLFCDASEGRGEVSPGTLSASRPGAQARAQIWVLRLLVLLGLCLPLSAEPGASDESSVLAFVEVIDSGDADAIYRHMQASFTTEAWQRREPEGWRSIATDLASFGGLTIHGIDADGGVFSISAATGRGDSVGLRLPMDNGRFNGLGLRLGPPPSPLGVPGPELGPGASDEDLRSAFSAFLDSVPGPLGQGFSGAILVARGQEVIFERAMGLASVRWQVPNRLETRFDLGSINKLFTQVAIARLASEGKLSGSDFLAKHLPDYPNAEVAEKVTIEQLMHHTSGLGDIFVPEFFQASKARFRRPADFFPLFAHQPLLFEPGEGRSYSNAGYQVLGAVIEKITGEPYAQAMARLVFEPAGMSSTGFFAADDPQADIAVGYTLQGTDGQIRNNLFRLPIIGSPAGSSFATVRDLWRFDQAFRKFRLVAHPYARWILGGPEPGAGGGESEPRLTTPIGVAGGAPGVSALMESDDEHAVIVLSNFDEPGAEAVGSALWRALKKSGLKKPGLKKPVASAGGS